MRRIIFSIIFSFILITSNAFAVELPFDGNIIIQSALNTPATTKFHNNIMNSVDGTELGSGISALLSFVRNFGVIAAVSVLAVMGVQFITASPQRKAELKSGFIPYLVGLLLLIAGVPIAITIIHIFTKII